MVRLICSGTGGCIYAKLANRVTRQQLRLGLPVPVWSPVWLELVRENVAPTDRGPECNLHPSWDYLLFGKHANASSVQDTKFWRAVTSLVTSAELVPVLLSIQAGSWDRVSLKGWC